ncbi:hypothetical protein [Tenacibaculum sp. M341]|uniref:hypothetical protein n=1 Tax=Tenacibaculum sp. M341 TaxID=2530339 RepID=UPI001404BD9D|nr:hypothetical protein [Tenacibaculum sp. M341]
MSKTLQYFLIGLGIACILVSLIGIMRGQKFLDVLPEIIIGVSLIISIFIEKRRKK